MTDATLATHTAAINPAATTAHEAAGAAAAATVPALFVSHGAPLFAIDAGTTGPALTQWGMALRARYPGLRGVVIMSPHWMARKPTVMTSAQPATWHDFGGFPPALYALQYPAPGAPALAQEVLDLLQAAGVPALGDSARPFDHGAWVPLMHLFPQADLPVVQVALPEDAGPAEVYALGLALRSLRDQNVLVMGSGSMTHNLGEFFGGAREPAPYVLEFSRWIEDAMARGDMKALLNYRSQAPHAERAHPSEDHFLPIFFALGAAGGDLRANYLSREVMYSMLSMDAFELQPAL
jgi:4,5-DOPA dioxygenase extradiol